MSASLFTLTIVLFLSVLGAAPIFFARRHGTLHIADFGIVLAPIAILLLTMTYLNRPVQIGWGTVIYSFLCLALSVVALYIRVFVGGRDIQKSHALSVTFLIVASFVALFVGLFVPAIYE
jgi:hypothetical protein